MRTLFDNEIQESTIEKKIIQSIFDRGYYVIKNQASSTTGSGRPDLSACIKGRYWAIEVKAARKNIKTTANQLGQLVQIANSGGVAMYSKTANIFSPYSNVQHLTSYSLMTVNTLLRREDVLIIKIIDDVQLQVMYK